MIWAAGPGHYRVVHSRLPPAAATVQGGLVNVAAALAAIAAEHSGLVPRRVALASGLGPSALRSAQRRGDLTDLRRGRYRFSGHLVDPAELIVAVESIPGAVASGPTAARAYGWPLPADFAPMIEVTVGRVGRRPRAGVAIRRAVLGEDERSLLPLGGGILPVTSPVRTALDLVPRLDLDDAVILLDAVRSSGRVPDSELGRGLATLAGVPGVRRASQAMALSRPGVDSPMETRGRLVFVRAGFLPTSTQYPLRVSRGRVVRVDLGFEDIRLLVEFDGYEFHHDRRAYRADRERWNAAVRAGWWMLRFTYEDVMNRPQAMVDAARAVAERATSAA